MNMGEKIKELRLKQDMTLEELGNKVGVGKSTVRKWETGMIENMRRDKIAKIANALNVSPAYLMGWEERPEKITVSGKCDIVYQDENRTDYVLEVIPNTKQREIEQKRIRIMYYINMLSDEGFEKLIERAAELEKMGYTKDGDNQ